MDQAVVTKEDAVTIYNRVMKQFDAIDKREKYKNSESNKSQ